MKRFFFHPSRQKFTLRKLLFILLAAQSAAFAAESGDDCASSAKLQPGLTCFDKKVYDCRSTNSTEAAGRMGYVACGELRIKNLESELDRRYQKLINSFKQPAKSGEDFELARASLVKSQSAWRNYIRADCDLQDSLLGTGNASAGVAVDCNIGHLRGRITRLKALGG